VTVGERLAEVGHDPHNEAGWGGFFGVTHRTQRSGDGSVFGSLGLTAKTTVDVALIINPEGMAAHDVFRDAPLDQLMVQTDVHRFSSIS
jgi:hypothetical protein